MIDERKQTIRQEIIDELENNAMTVREISQSIGILEKDVYHHLTFIEKTVKHQKKRIRFEPYYCMNCGFQFTNRKTFKRPGKCPGCRDGRISFAIFSIVSIGD
jgi:predicted Zn-ribbon and HTH transcriptional regulator